MKKQKKNNCVVLDYYIAEDEPKATLPEAIDVVKPLIEEYKRKEAFKEAWKSVFKAIFSFFALIISAILKFVTGVGRVLGIILTMLSGFVGL